MRVTHLLLAAALALPAAAQTGRVAHVSHGGSRARLKDAARADNFGALPEERVIERVVYVSDSVARLEGRARVMSGNPEPWRKFMEARYQFYFPHYHASREAALQKLHEDYPTAKFVGFKKGKNGKAAVPGVGHRKLPPAAFGAAALLAVLAGAGWLLAGRDQKAVFSV